MTTCTNCHATFEGKYCNQCGQKNYTEKDKSIKHLIEEAFHFMTHFEGAFFVTLKTIFTKPGLLTVEYCDGIRKKYFKPLSFYLLIVVLYLLFPGFKGLNPELNGYKRFAAGPYIERQIEAKLQRDGISEEALSEAFAHASHSVAKFMLLILIPVSALLLSLLFYKKRPLFDQFILATEINIFYLLGLFTVFPLLLRLVASTGLVFVTYDDFVAPVIVLLFTIFNTLVFKRVFQSSTFISALKSFVFSVLHLNIVLILYKLLVFEITILLI
jgi:hypothetical protein